MRRRALVTGASSGIGAATAVLLAQQDYDVWLTFAHSREAAEDVANECSGRGIPPRLTDLDLRSPASIDTLADEVSRHWGHLDVLVNNGGTCPYRAYDAIDVEEWDQVLETNARGTFLLSRALLPALRSSREQDSDRSIVNVSSIAGQVGSLKTGIHYAASKAAILAITRSFARLLAAERIRVNAVTPGPVDSNITAQLGPSDHESLASSVPLGRFGRPDEVAWVIASLAGTGASFVTGATYDVNGGVRID